eukprot:4807703-Pyramimonas_sp.AAC.2
MCEVRCETLDSPLSQPTTHIVVLGWFLGAWLLGSWIPWTPDSSGSWSGSGPRGPGPLGPWCLGPSASLVRGLGIFFSAPGTWVVCGPPLGLLP